MLKACFCLADAGCPLVLPRLLGRLASFPNVEKGDYFWKLVKINRNVSTKCLCVLLRTPMAVQGLVHLSSLSGFSKIHHLKYLCGISADLHLLAFPKTDSSWQLPTVAVIPVPGRWVKPKGHGARSWDLAPWNDLCDFGEVPPSVWAAADSFGKQRSQHRLDLPLEASRGSRQLGT